MTMQYKVWLEIEEVDESRDLYRTVDTPGASPGTMVLEVPLDGELIQAGWYYFGDFELVATSTANSS